MLMTSALKTLSNSQFTVHPVQTPSLNLKSTLDVSLTCGWEKAVRENIINNIVKYKYTCLMLRILKFSCPGRRIILFGKRPRENASFEDKGKEAKMNFRIR
jgi:hypothetical protein